MGNLLVCVNLDPLSRRTIYLDSYGRFHKAYEDHVAPTFYFYKPFAILRIT